MIRMSLLSLNVTSFDYSVRPNLTATMTIEKTPTLFQLWDSIFWNYYHLTFNNRMRMTTETAYTSKQNSTIVIIDVIIILTFILLLLLLIFMMYLNRNKYSKRKQQTQSELVNRHSNVILNNRSSHETTLMRSIPFDNNNLSPIGLFYWRSSLSVHSIISQMRIFILEWSFLLVFFLTLFLNDSHFDNVRFLFLFLFVFNFILNKSTNVWLVYVLKFSYLSWHYEKNYLKFIINYTQLIFSHSYIFSMNDFLFLFSCLCL